MKHTRAGESRGVIRNLRRISSVPLLSSSVRKNEKIRDFYLLPSFTAAAPNSYFSSFSPPPHKTQHLCEGRANKKGGRTRNVWAQALGSRGADTSYCRGGSGERGKGAWSRRKKTRTKIPPEQMPAPPGQYSRLRRTLRLRKKIGCSKFGARDGSVSRPGAQVSHTPSL